MGGSPGDLLTGTNEKGEYVSDHNAIWADIVLK